MVSLKSFRPLIAVISLLCLLLAAAPQARSQGKANPQDKLKELLQERLVTAQSIHDLVLKGHTQGATNITIDQVHEAKVMLLNARLDLAESKEQRIRVHEEMVKEAAEWEQLVIKALQAGQGSPIDVLKAKVYRLERQIALERARMA